MQYIDVQPSYSGFIDLEYNPTGGDPHLQMFPGDSGVVPLTFSNTGNQIGSWNLGGVYLDEPTWDPSQLIRWTDKNGDDVRRFVPFDLQDDDWNLSRFIIFCHRFLLPCGVPHAGPLHAGC